MSSSLRLLVLALWSTVLLLSERRLLGQYVAVNAEANLVPEFECTAVDGGRCDRIRDGSSCPIQECAPRTSIDLQEHSSGCSCFLPPNFCDGEQARSTSDDFPVNIVYSIPYHQQFSVTASVKSLVGNWNYKMMMTDRGATKITDNRCICGPTQDQEILISRTDNFDSHFVNRSLHLCLWNASRTVYIVKNFFAGSSCSDFVRHHRLPSHFCNQPVREVGPVKHLTVNSTSIPSTLQVSWTKPGFLLGVGSITYYLTLNSTLGTHTFNVSNSTNVTCTVRAGLNYTVTVRTWIWCEETSCRQQVSQLAFVPPVSTTTLPTLSPTPPTLSTTGNLHSTNDRALFIVIFVVSAIFFIFITVLVIVVFCHWSARKNRRSRRERCYVESPGISNSCSTETASSAHVDTISHTGSDQASDVISNTHTGHDADQHTVSKQVLIVGSQRIPTEEHARLVARPLLAYEHIKILMHNVNTVEADRRLTPSEWVQQAMDRADFVVCICNKEFLEDWSFNGQRMCHERSLVRNVSHHVAGLVNHGQDSKVMQKFIAVVHCEEDLQYIPTNLRNCNSFILNCDANVDGLARHLLGIPAVTLMDSTDHISSRL